VDIKLLTGRYAAQIAGVLSCGGRMLIFGSLPKICHAGEMTSYLYERKVRIGAFKSERKANKLKAQLQRKYPGSSVIEFPGEASYRVRIRLEGDNREQAERIASRCAPPKARRF
jgi:NADPH:quinone reductase-like Zn-dependent oxidoreductase